MTGWSAMCAEERHLDCSGCENCPCHLVGPPANFRQMVARARDRARETRGGR